MSNPFGRCFFFFNDTATTEIYTLSLHDALPVSSWPAWRPKARLACPASITWIAATSVWTPSSLVWERRSVVKRSGYEGHPHHRSLQGQAAGARDRPLQTRGLGAQGYFARKPPADLRASGQRDYAHDRQAQRRPHLRGIRSRGCGGRRRGYLDGTGDGCLRAARSGIWSLPPRRGRAAT